MAEPESAANTPPLVTELLQEYGTLTRKRLARWLPAGQPRAHLYDLVADYPARGGKMMRPTLCIAAARAFGARVEEALDSAVAIELLHNALLIHDDIEDESEERRGRPTLHQLHGVPLALNAGDMLILLGLRPLLENIDRLGPRLAKAILLDARRMARESAEGQAMELGWRQDNVTDLRDADYLEMVLKKTCWLATILPSRIGALIGSRGRAPLTPLVRFGFFLGAAFQIQDDLLNLIADARYGKERCGDLYEGKRTLMLLHTYRQAVPDERVRIDALLAAPRPEKRAEDIAWLRGLMERGDSIAYARSIAHGLAGAALHELDVCFGHLPDSRDKRFVHGLVTWVFERI
ncbi:MAG: polyprenyl synthetase family protein [Thiohalocapsa sp.]|jgi:geranylgeranyl diphosphate synthase type II